MAQSFWTDHGRAVVVAGAAGVFMALAGPFGTHGAPLLTRFTYWVPTMIFGSLVGVFVTRLASTRPKIGDNAFWLWAVTTIALTPPITLFVLWYTNIVFGVNPGGIAFLAPSVFLVSAAMTGIMILTYRPGLATHAPPPSSGPVRARFLDRLTPKIMGGEIHAVAAEDHYLRIYTSKGEDLILMRLSDAIAELEGIEGAQTHRSWWVAKEAVATVERDGSKLTLVLKDGARAPISRPNVKPLCEAGWF
jgi:hypothetical protein